MIITLVTQRMTFFKLCTNMLSKLLPIFDYLSFENVDIQKIVFKFSIFAYSIGIFVLMKLNKGNSRLKSVMCNNHVVA
jgi:hypothetical protein